MDELTREMDFSTGMSGEKGEIPAADGSVTKLTSCQNQVTHWNTYIHTFNIAAETLLHRIFSVPMLDFLLDLQSGRLI